MNKTNVKAICLVSGGLDSILAALLIKKQGIKVKALIFKSVFFSGQKGIKAAKQLKIPYKVIDITEELLKAIKEPKYGLGGGANPCIDCHLIMLKKAKQVMKKQNFDFVATGEVLGQRPFSQNKQAMKLLAEKSDLNERLVRPLSALKLDQTLPEKKEWIDRDKLLGINGRSRKTQLELAEKFNLSFPQPGGGCMLTETGFASKVFDFKKHLDSINITEAKLLKTGRHFWQGNRLIIIGKNEKENKKLEKLAQPSDKIITPANFIGPTALIKGKDIDGSLISNTKQLILKHTPSRKQGVFKQPLLFFGSSSESIIVLEEILNSEIPVCGVVTKPDRECGRGQKVQPCPLAQYAKKQNLTVFKPEKLNFKTRQKIEQKIKFKPHWGIVAVYGNIIPKSWLNWFNIILNIHPSLLPKWRGAAPTIRAIESGNKTSGWTIFKLTEKMDAGPIITQKKVKIKYQENTGRLTNRLFKSASRPLVKILTKLYQSEDCQFWVMTPQDNSQATYAEKVEKKEAKIDWSKSSEQIINKIRAFNPWPGAYTTININNEKKRLKIWTAHIENDKVIPDIVHLAGKCRCSWQQFSHAYNLTLKDIKN
jgi:tRNA-uridine 2-sulfurtransferase